MNNTDLRPKKRSKIRVGLGKRYYTYHRYMKWMLGKEKYALKKESTLLPTVIFQHSTPLLRKLKDVDMWMQHNKIKNLQLAMDKINKITLNPGETFSYWRLIGKPTKKKGYVDGMVLYYGTLQIGIGGGLCQLSNLLYWITLHTPLTVIERYRHSFDVFPDSNREQPFGSGATCYYNYKDLQIYNSTNETFQLHVYFKNNRLFGEWRTVYPYDRTYKVYEKSHSITHECWGGYVRHNTIHRKTFNEQGNFVDDEYITENHAVMMYQPFLSDKKVL